MFGFFKKKKKVIGPHYDPTQIKITDLRKGWFLTYDDKTWEVVEEFEYDWGKEQFSYEFLLDNGEGDQQFLSLDEDDGLTCVLFKKVRFSQLPEADDIAEKIINTHKAPRRVQAQGRTFYLEAETPGYFRNIKESEFREFIVWEYWDETETKALNIEQWGDNSFEAAIGNLVAEREFTDLTPAQREE